MTPLVASCSVGESNVRFSGWALSPPLTEVRHGTTWELGLTREEKDLVVDRDWRERREGERRRSPERRRQLPLSESGSPNLGRFNYHKSTHPATNFLKIE